MMNRRIRRDDNHRQGGGGRGLLRLKGVTVVRLLACFLLALNGLLVYAIVFSSHGLPGFIRQKEQVKEFQEKVENLKEENQKLFEMIEAFKSDPKAQEKLVRQELGWVRENEVVLQFPEKTCDPPGTTAPSGRRPLPPQKK